MKKHFLTLAVFLVIIGFSSCSLFRKEISFNVNDTVNTKIPATLNINVPFNIPIPPVSTSATEEFENKHTAPDLLEKVALTDLTITITSPSDQTFAFLNEIYIYIQKSDGSDERLIASATNISSTSKTISLTCTEENLVPYLQESSYKLRLKVKAKQILTHDVYVSINLKFRVTAQLIK